MFHLIWFFHWFFILNIVSVEPDLHSRVRKIILALSVQFANRSKHLYTCISDNIPPPGSFAPEALAKAPGFHPWGILRSLATAQASIQTTHIVSPEGIGPLSSRPRPESNRDTPGRKLSPVGNYHTVRNHAYGRVPHTEPKRLL